MHNNTYIARRLRRSDLASVRQPSHSQFVFATQLDRRRYHGDVLLTGQARVRDIRIRDND